MQENNKTAHRKKITIATCVCVMVLVGLFCRLLYLMIWRADYYSNMATELHERERSIKAARGRIIDANGTVIAANRTVCTVSVIHSQLTEPEQVIEMLCRELELEEAYVRKRVEKYSSIERIKSNVDKETGDRIREYDLAGVKVDEDYKRYYPFGELASKVLGFTGSDNQGIIGLEVKYDDVLQGEAGKILTMTDAAGIEVEAAGERRIEPVAGKDLHISLDMNIQSYATQLAEQAYLTKEADSVSILVMNPQNGEILAMVNVPEFDLNNPYELTPEYAVQETNADGVSREKSSADILQEQLNKMWRNGCINDTY